MKILKKRERARAVVYFDQQTLVNSFSAFYMFFFIFVEENNVKTSEKTNSTSESRAKHPFPGQKTQQLIYI